MRAGDAGGMEQLEEASGIAVARPKILLLAAVHSLGSAAGHTGQCYLAWAQARGYDELVCVRHDEILWRHILHTAALESSLSRGATTARLYSDDIQIPFPEPRGIIQYDA